MLNYIIIRNTLAERAGEADNEILKKEEEGGGGKKFFTTIERCVVLFAQGAYKNQLRSW